MKRRNEGRVGESLRFWFLVGRRRRRRRRRDEMRCPVDSVGLGREHENDGERGRACCRKRGPVEVDRRAFGESTELIFSPLGKEFYTRSC